MAIFDRKDDYLFVRWARAVKKRDHYMCQLCEGRGELNSHHLNGWNTFPDERYSIENGVTLCKTCHNQFHDRYGRGGNTKEQFDEFTAIYQLMKRSTLVTVKLSNNSKKILDVLRKDIEIKDGYVDSFALTD